MTVVNIPGETVAILRSALQTALGHPAAFLEEASEAKDREKQPELFRLPLAELTALCIMLDAIGWREPNDPSTQQDVRFDFDMFRRLAVDAMRTRLVAERDFLTERDDSGEHDVLYERARRDAQRIEAFLAEHDPTER